MKKYCKVFKAILMLIMMAVLISAKGQTVYAAKDEFTVKVEYGYDNKIQVGCYIPVYVTVTNNAKNFEGAVQIIVPGGNYNTMHEKEISIAAGDTKTIVLTVPFKVNAPQFTVRIVDKDDDVEWKEYIKTDVLKTITTANIGILSDDFSALGYMADQTLFNYSDISTKIYELTAEKLPEDYKALDMLDAIVISNFSTDKLTSAQIEAIDQWVEGGGLLLLGSGSTVNKTFAGIDGVIFDAVIGDFKTYNTKFGLSSILESIIKDVYDYDYRDNYFASISLEEQEGVYGLLDKYQDSWSKDYYDTFFYSFYEENSDYLEDVFRDIFQDDYYGGYQLTDEEWKDYGENEFYYFVYDLFDRLVVLRKRALQIGENVATAENMPFVKADILNVSLKGQGSYLYGETETGGTYALVNAVNKGEGMVAVAGIDFTQNPMASFTGNKMFFASLIDNLIGYKLYDKMNMYQDYYYGYYYNDSNEYYWSSLADSANNAMLPPMLIYIVIIGLYLVGGLVIYFVLKKRKKSMLFWGAQAGLALIFAVVVYLAGFTTRKVSPEFNVAVVTELANGNENISAAGKLLMPKKKDYELSIRKEYAVKLIEEDYYYYSYNISNRDYDTYYLAESVGIDSYNYELCNTQALGNQGFKMSAIADTTKDVIIDLYINQDETDAETKVEIDTNNGNYYNGSYYVSSNGSYVTMATTMVVTVPDKGYYSNEMYYSYSGSGLAGTVTNNYGVTLEDAIVFFEGEFYLLGDIAPGESVNLANAEVIADRYYRYNMNYIFGEQSYDMSKFLFGNSAKNRKEEMKYAFYEYVNDTVVNQSYYNNSGQGAFFFAFPSECDKTVLLDTDIKENVYEMVCKWIALEDIEGITVSYGEGY